jgi:hypothetical protein
VVWQVVGKLLERLVHDGVVVLADFFGLLIDHVWEERRTSGVSFAVSFSGEWRGKGLVGERGEGCCAARDIHTDDGLGVTGARCPQAELAQVVLGLLREGE